MNDTKAQSGFARTAQLLTHLFCLIQALHDFTHDPGFYFGARTKYLQPYLKTNAAVLG